MKQFLTFLLLATAIGSAISQSPWVREKGGYFGQLSFQGIPEAVDYFGRPDSVLLEDVYATAESSVQGYFEYGVSKRLTLIAAVPLRFASFSNPNLELVDREISGLGNVDLTAKYALSTKIPFTLNLLVSTPTATQKAAIRTGYDAWGFAPSLSLGGSTGKAYGYLNAGTTLRSNNYSNDGFLMAEGGYKWFKKLYTILVIDVRASAMNGSRTDTGSFLFQNNQEYFAYGLKFAYEINKRMGVTAYGFGAASGNLVAKSPAVGIGFYFKSKEE